MEESNYVFDYFFGALEKSYYCHFFLVITIFMFVFFVFTIILFLYSLFSSKKSGMDYVNSIALCFFYFLLYLQSRIMYSICIGTLDKWLVHWSWCTFTHMIRNRISCKPFITRYAHILFLEKGIAVVIVQASSLHMIPYMMTNERRFLFETQSIARFIRTNIRILLLMPVFYMLL